MGKHTKHGWNKDSPEYKKMTYICSYYKISRKEYLEDIDKWKVDARKRTSEEHSKYEIGSKEYKRSCFLKFKYGITYERYNEIFESQEGCCAICKIHQSELKKALNVDHNHTTGNVRGLLCNECNTSLGKLKESKEILMSAINYLEKYKNNQ